MYVSKEKNLEFNIGGKKPKGDDSKVVDNNVDEEGRGPPGQEMPSHPSWDQASCQAPGGASGSRPYPPPPKPAGGRVPGIENGNKKAFSKINTCFGGTHGGQGNHTKKNQPP